MATPNILVVDSDEGFGFMLTEGIQNTAQYTATCVHTGSDALEAVVEQNFDLVIIDMGLNDMKPATLIQAIHEAKSETRIMMIPLIGQELPATIHQLGINGVLPKPFFVGDLPDLIANAIGRSKQRTPTPASLSIKPTTELPGVPAGTVSTVQDHPLETSASEIEAPAFVAMASPLPQETIRFLRANEAEILRLLNDLNREVRAEAILLIAGVDLIAQSGMLGRNQCQELALLVAQSSQAAAQAAQFLGERTGRFTQSLHEGGEYRLYTLTLSEGILLSLALSTNVPLGMIRHQCRQIAEQLSKFII